MKKIISLILSFIILSAFNSCDNNNLDEIDRMQLNIQKYQLYLDPFIYSLGRNDWNKAEDISPDAFVVFYFVLPLMDELTIPEDYDIDKTFGNPLIPADDLESTVQKYFDFEIPKDYIKQSEYYLEESNSYFTGGIGSTVDIKVKEVEHIDNELIIKYDAWINSTDYKNNWNGTVTIILHDEDGFRYKSHNENRLNINNYMEPIEHSSLLLNTWETAENIPIDDMMIFLSINSSYQDYWDNNEQIYKVPFNIFFDNCNKYFDVTEEYLKTSNLYIEETDCFESSFGYGGANDIEVINVEQDNENIKLEYVIYYANPETRKDDIYCKGILTIIKEKDSYKYKSCILTREKAF